MRVRCKLLLRVAGAIVASDQILALDKVEVEQCVVTSQLLPYYFWNYLAHFKSDGVYAFAWSRDGQWLALSRGQQMTDAVLISEGR